MSALQCRRCALPPGSRSGVPPHRPLRLLPRLPCSQSLARGVSREVQAQCVTRVGAQPVTRVGIQPAFPASASPETPAGPLLKFRPGTGPHRRVPHQAPHGLGPLHVTRLPGVLRELLRRGWVAPGAASSPVSHLDAWSPHLPPPGGICSGSRGTPRFPFRPRHPAPCGLHLWGRPWGKYFPA